MTDTFRKTKSNWIRPSLNPMNPRDADPNLGYQTRAPWDSDKNEMLDEFERSLKALEVDVKSPWEEGSLEFEIRDREQRNAANYKYESLFEVPPLSDKKLQQLAEYKINPPFRCEYNGVDEPKKTAKKLDPKGNPKTREPWNYGTLPAEPTHRKTYERPSTGLWDVSRGDQGGNTANFISSGDPILDNLRKQLLARGASGIAGLARKFRIMDDDGSGQLDMNEFRKGMKECELVDLTERAIKHLFSYFDKDDTGTITYDEFVVGIRGVMNDRRRNLVALAFHVLDSDRSGVIDLADMRLAYNAKSHPDVVMGRRTEDDILAEFMQNFQVGKKQKTAITLDDFCDYYASISASVDSDDYFELMIRNAWHISGGEGQYANSTNRRILVTHADGKQSVEEIKDDIRIGRGDTTAMMNNLKAQGIDDALKLNLSDKLNQKNTYVNEEVLMRQRQEQGQGYADDSQEPEEIGGGVASLAAFANNPKAILQMQQQLRRPSNGSNNGGAGGQQGLGRGQQQGSQSSFQAVGSRRR
jgi:Ca2+-binding EF-hand superfamily protein